VRRLDDLRLIGIFDIAGPDKGRIDPFWRMSYVGEPLLTVRGAGGAEATTMPVILDMAVVQDFLRSVESHAHLSLWSAASYRSVQVGIIFQAYNLLPQLTAIQNVALPMMAADL
jgi:ABC-type ATPase involved in cell division